MILKFLKKTKRFLINFKHFVHDYKLYYENLNTEMRKIREVLAYQLLIEDARDVHGEVFPKYKNCHRNMDVAVIGGGPTLDKWIAPQECIQIGVNATCQAPNVHLDYCFWNDYGDEMLSIIKHANSPNCKYFFGHTDLYGVQAIPFYIAEDVGAERYFHTNKYNFPYTDNYPYEFPIDISKKPFFMYGTTIHIAMQFALYTHPKRIYIVGCDCSAGHSSKYPNILDAGKAAVDLPPQSLDVIIQGWQKLANFAQQLYPDIEIISVNPVNLKGVFKDIYT